MAQASGEIKRRAQGPSAGHGADPKFVFHADYVPDGGPAEDVFRHRINNTSILMAAVGMGGGREWVAVDRNQKEALTLEAVKIAVESGSDVNVANTDGRTALDAARGLRYDSVIQYLESKGAKGNAAPTPQRGQRGQRGAPNPL